MKSYISKTTMMRAIQCKLAFYYDMIELPYQSNANLSALFEQGHEVESYFKSLYNEGINCSTGDGNVTQAISKTKKALLSTNETFFNPAFMVEISGINYYAQTDIIDESESGWEIMEVKSSTKVKWMHIYDMAFQWRIINQIYPGIKKVPYLVHLNPEFRKGKELNIENMFVRIDLSSEVVKNQPLLERNIYWMKKMMQTKKQPIVIPSTHCFYPYKCKYTEVCLPGLKTQSVYFKGLKKNKKKAQHLLDYGVEELNNLSVKIGLTKWDWKALKSKGAAKPKVDKNSLSKFLRSFSSSLYYCDFGVTSFAVPLYDRTGPYHRLIYQYCIRSENNDGIKFKNEIVDPKRDGRKAILLKFIQDTNEPGDIIVFNKYFIKSVLTRYGKIYPELNVVLKDRMSRMKDLLLPFMNGQILEPKLRYDFSLSNIGPILFPNIKAPTKIVKPSEAGWKFQHLNEKSLVEFIQTKKLLIDFLEYRVETLFQLHHFLKRKAGVKGQ